MHRSLASSWLAVQCRWLPSVAQGIVVLAERPEQLTVIARWPEGAEVDPVLAEGARQALARGAVALQEASEPGGESRVSFPVVVNERVVAAVAFRLEAGGPETGGPDFRGSVLPKLEYGASFLGPLLASLPIEDASPSRWKLPDWISALREPTALRERLIAFGVVALVLSALLAKGDYRVTADATLEGRVHRAVVAPFDGYVETASVRAGDVVEAQQLLATLQERDLDLERERRLRERDKLGRLYDRALAELDHAETSVLTARKAEADLALQLVDRQRARTRLLAPFEGVVVSGDLSRSLGAPVGRGQVLFEVAPLEGYRVVLHVDERDIAEIAEGQAGQLVLGALPGDRLDFIVDKVTPVAQAVEGRNVFQVEADLEDARDALRPGMQGIAKIVVGRRRHAWIWTHGLWDWLGFQAWAWRP